MRTRQTPSTLAATRDTDGPQPRISVAISTYQRPSQLPALIESLSNQTLQRSEYEVILVDNGSTPETAETIRSLAATTDLQLCALRIEPNRGPAAARNVAWENARANVIAFTDDDCAPTPTWLEEGLRAFGDGHAIIVGRTLPDPGQEIGPFSRWIRVEDVNWLPTCNVFYRRDDLDVVDGFDEAFLLPACEDTDLAYRVRNARGRTFSFAPAALVYHEVRPSRFFDAAKETLRWVGSPRLFKRHPEARTRLHRGIFWKPSHPKALLATLGLLLSINGAGWALLTLPWLYYRTLIRRPSGNVARAYAALPGTFINDMLEVGTMVRGSIRSRTVVL